MRFLVFGAGAVGGALAVRLASAGEEVAVIARGAHAAAIQARGLTLTTGGETRTVRIPCVQEASALAQPPDVVFVTVKQPQMPHIAESLGQLQQRGARVVLAMNGIGWWFVEEMPIPDRSAFVDLLDPGGRLRKSIDLRTLAAAVVQSSNEVVAPGSIVGTTPTRNRLLPGKVTADAELELADVCTVLQRAGYDSFPVADIRREIWNKMALWLAVCPVSALTQLPLDRLVADAEGFALMTTLLRETNSIGRRLGFDLADDADERVDFYRDKPTRTSLLKDFELGREPELASGVLVFAALAQELGVAAPHVSMVATLARLRHSAMRSGG